MFKLLRFQFRKLFRSKSFYICTFLLIILAGVSVYTIKLINDQVISPDGVIIPSLEMTGLDSLMQGIPNSAISTMLGIFIAIFACEDYAAGTMRTILTRGYTRFSVYVSQFVVIIAAAVIMSVVCAAASFGIGSILWGVGDAEFGKEQVIILLYQLLVMLASSALFYAAASIIQKPGGAIAFCVVLPLAATILLNLADNAFAEKELEISSYWLDNLCANIGHMTVEDKYMDRALMCSGIYFAFSLIVGWLGIMKREY